LICFYKGTWNGATIPINDTPEVVTFSKEAWKNGSIRETATRFLSNLSFWDQDLTKIEGLTDRVVTEMDKLGSSQKS
jgi:tagaturonate reductase